MDGSNTARVVCFPCEFDPAMASYHVNVLSGVHNVARNLKSSVSTADDEHTLALIIFAVGGVIAVGLDVSRPASINFKVCRKHSRLLKPCT